MRSGMIGFLGAPKSRLWTPLDLTVPPKILLDDQSPITEVSGAASEWFDRSGNAYDFIQTVAGNRPAVSDISGTRAFAFDGVTDRIFDSTIQGRDLFRNTAAGWGLAVVQRSETGTATRIIFASSTPNSGVARFRMDIANNRLRWAGRRLDGDTAVLLSGTTTIDTGPHVVLMTMDWANADCRLYLDGELEAENLSAGTAGSTSDTASSASDSLLIGANSNAAEAFFSGKIGALVSGRGSIPTSGEIDKLFGCYMWHFGLEANLPIGHPYKSAPPMV